MEQVTFLQLLKHGAVGSLRGGFLHHGVVVGRVERLAHRRQRSHPEPAQGLEKSLVHQFETFQKRGRGAGLASVFQSQLHMVHHGQQLFEQIFVGELQQLGLLPLQPLLQVLRFRGQPEVPLVILLGFLSLFFQLKL